MIRNFLLLILLILISNSSFGQYQINALEKGNRITEVKVSHFKQKENLTIRVVGKNVSILGEWSFNNSTMIFAPLVALTSSKVYEVYLNEDLIGSFKGSNKKLISPMISAFYPSSDTVPENLLKCSVIFSQPMWEGNIYEYITVIDQKGDSLNDIFLPLEPALWNYDKTVLTLWVDPGRVKRDLLRNQHLGKPLEKGKKYKVIISQNWKGINGVGLKNEYQKELYITNRDEDVPNVNQWQLKVPKIMTKSSFKILFSEKMDYLTSLEGINIEYDGKKVKGVTSLLDNEKIWSFAPERPWKEGKYIVKLNPVIEDQSGNNLLRPFDVDLQDKTIRKENPLQLTFTIH